MPKLNGYDDKMLFGYKVDKETDECDYNDEYYLYFSKSDGSPYISVTQLIHKYVPAFDADFWSSYKACESLLDISVFYDLKQKLLSTKRWKDEYLELYNINKDAFLLKKAEILQSYADKNKEACEHGSKVHEMMENMFYQKDETILKRFNFNGNVDVSKGYYKFDKERSVYPEILLSYSVDEYLKVCGQADLIIKDGNDIWIYDYKTNSSINKQSFYDKNTKKRDSLMFPLNNIQNSNYWIYSLQLSLYMYMIQQLHPSFKCKKLALIHIDRDYNQTEYECDYLKEDVARMLLDYRKKEKIRIELERDKPIIW